jgi:hypothetical protein
LESFTGPWAPIEAELGTLLPQDYKDYARIYGSGRFLQFLRVNVPRTGHPNIRLESEIPVVCRIFAEFDLDERPYPLWPEPGGLLPFGRTDDGDILFWLQRGVPDEWPIVVWGRGLWNYELFECGLTDFLAGLATGAILPKDFPEYLVPVDCLFAPTTPQVWVPVEYRASARMSLTPLPPNPWRSWR